MLITRNGLFLTPSHRWAKDINAAAVFFIWDTVSALADRLNADIIDA